jgi:hypothetical protein
MHGSDLMMVAVRPKSHPKGRKVIARWPYGTPVPAGVIIGKGTIIKVKVENGEELLRSFKRQAD